MAEITTKSQNKSWDDYPDMKKDITERLDMNQTNEGWEKNYWENIVPKMPNVDHTEAISFIRNLLALQKQKIIEMIEDKAEYLSEYDPQEGIAKEAYI